MQVHTNNSMRRTQIVFHVQTADGQVPGYDLQIKVYTLHDVCCGITQLMCLHIIMVSVHLIYAGAHK